MLDVLLNTLIQIGIFVGAVFGVGFIISLINRFFYHLAGTSKAVVYGTGFIGTPIHELSHAFFCVVFFHHIEEIKLFQISDEDGTLGYVSHSYNRRNIYQIIGNFFIGTAPILVGTTLLMLMLFLITPSTFGSITSALSPSMTYADIFPTLGKVIKAFFSGVSDWKWWLYLLFVILVAIHMNLSTADLKGTLISLPFIIIILFIVNFAIYFINKDAYQVFNKAMITGETYLILILAMSLFFSLLTLGVGAIIYLVRRVTGRV